MPGCRATSATQPPSVDRVPCLDGLRGISIALVCWCHLAPSFGDRLPSWLRRAGREAEIGVDFFFVISGLLITLLLLRDEDRTGRIAIKRFLARRALRLVPAYTAYLGFVAALVAAGLVSIRPNDWLAAISYTTDLVTLLGRDPPWVFAHLWSLAVEEHFYLAWPVALALLGRSRARQGLLVLLALVPSFRAIEWLALPEAVRHGLIKFSTPTRIDAIGAGCLLGFQLAGREPGAGSPSRNGVGWPTVLAVGTFLGSSIVYSAVGLLEVALKPTIKVAVIALLVSACLRSSPNSPLARVLNWRPVVGVGLLSYSLYLWQQPFLNASAGPIRLGWPTNLAATIGFALLSHLAIERPFLRLKERIAYAGGEPPRPHYGPAMTSALRS